MNTNINTGRFIRWQTTTIEERGRVISLFLTLSLATIAFLSNQIVDKDFRFGSIWSERLIVIGSLFLLSCTLITIFLSLNRLKDFNETMKIVRAKMKRAPADEITAMEAKNIRTGRITRWFFNCSIWCFGIGELLVITGLIIQFKDKIGV